MSRKDRHGLYVGTPSPSQEGAAEENPVIAALEKVEQQGRCHSVLSGAAAAPGLCRLGGLPRLQGVGGAEPAGAP